MLPVQARRALLGALAALWALPGDCVERLTALHKPEMRAGLGEVAVGRAVLPMMADERAARSEAASRVGCSSVTQKIYRLQAPLRC